jgi:hypothetical protein
MVFESKIFLSLRNIRSVENIISIHNEYKEVLNTKYRG